MSPSTAIPALLLLALAACGGARPAPEPAPATAATTAAAGVTVAASAPADTGRPRANAAAVRFLDGMIAHHGQALAMTALVPSRAARDDVRRLAERIDISQRDEIGLMQRWLVAHGEQAPDPSSPHAHHDAGHAAAMPGMLTPEEMARLAASTGAAFDRLFLEGMIRHHEGALVMVRDLFAAPGGTQDSELFRLASDVETDQRAEIARMRALLAAMRQPNPPTTRP